MKTGRTLEQLLAEVLRQRDAKKDYVASTEHMQAVANGPGSVTLQVGDDPSMNFAINNHANRQIGEHTGIPAKYYDRMLADAPDLLARNINVWLGKEPAKRMVRTLDGKVRAFLSNGFRPLENDQLAEAVVPVLLQRDLEILSCEVTERRLYIKAVDKRIERQVPGNGKNRMGDGSHVIFDCLSPAIVVGNSEVGSGALSVETGVWTKACTNMAIFKQASMRKYHVGAKHEIGEQMYALLSDKTRAMTDAAMWAQVRDVVAGAFDQAAFDARVLEIGGMVEQKITGDVVKVVEVASKRFGATETERKSILTHLIEGGDLSKYGLFNAFTRAAEDIVDYDRATEFERIGGEIIELPKTDWEVIAEAA